MPMSRLRKLIASRRGNAAIEFAVAAPVMLLLTGGIVEFGLIFKVYNQVNKIATQYASAWSDCTDNSSNACGTELANYTDASAKASSTAFAIGGTGSVDANTSDAHVRKAANPR